MEIFYRVNEPIELEIARELYRSCTLGARRPIEDDARLSAMLIGADVLVSAWENQLLVGLARSLTDWSYATYVADLAVRESHQKRGIGRELLRQTRAQAPLATLTLLAAPQAENYYDHIGFARHRSGWILQPGAEL